MTVSEVHSPTADHRGGLGAVLARLGGRIAYGGDYNPEQWPPEVWAEDVRLMAEAGVNLVSLGIFAWAALEAEPGHYDFGWLREVMDLLHGAGVSVCLATATASPPPWLARLDPSSLPEDADGRRLWPGGRQHYCPSSSTYRERAARLVARLAEAVRDHPALVAWHVGNEYGCHVARCYCDASAAAFRAWLERRYQSIERLNDAWSTAFWSQHYRDFGEVLPPRRAPTFPNPAQQLDFARFSSDELRGLFAAEAAILRQVTPEVPLTTNFMGAFAPVDYFAWAKEEDFVSHDSYPDPLDPDGALASAFGFDLVRSVGGGRPWLLLEQAPSAVNWRPVNGAKPPGLMRAWSFQAIGRGADGIMFFQWRASAGGAEKFHSGMVPHAGPETRVHREVAALGAELAALRGVAGSEVEAEVGLLFDWESWWAAELDSHPSRELRVLEIAGALYRPLFDANLTVDFVHPLGDLSRYRLVVVPSLYLVEDRAAQRLADFVAAGGVALVTFFSGIVDPCDRIRLGGYPGAFRDLLGVVSEEFWPLPADRYVEVAWGGAGSGSRTPLGEGSFAATLWQEDLHLRDAVAVASYRGGPLDGVPAITRVERGRGQAWYLATLPEPDALARLLQVLAEEAGVEPPLSPCPPKLEVVRRRHPDGRAVLVVVNHGAPTHLDLRRPARDLLTGRLVTSLDIERYGVRTLEERPE